MLDDLAFFFGYIYYVRKFYSANDRSMYEKAREYAREVTLLFLTVQAMRCARNGITTIKNVFQNKADLLSILRRKGTTPAKEILENPTELEILMPETGAELFASYKGLLEEEAITAYEKKVTRYTLEKGRDLKSIIQKAAGKLERKLTKSELEKILRWQDEEVAEETICDWLCGESGSNFIKNNLVNKIKDIRGKMPNTNLAKRGNMAVADVDIPDIKDNFVAHSKINTEFDKGADVAEFSYLKPENERIFTTYVDDQYPRYHDTEAKILEDIASQITDPNISGTINLYFELPCCQSCTNIILEFRRRFPNIKLNVYVE